MLEDFHPITDVLEFIEMGGGVIVLITLALIAMWTLIFERAWYFRRLRRQELPEIRHYADHHRDRRAELALQIRENRMRRRLPMIRALIGVCPLLGLLGTVLGMIEVFEVTALSGSGNVRAIAAGVSTATVTTMAGLVAALSGMLLLSLLDRFVRNEQRRAEQLLATR